MPRLRYGIPVALIGLLAGVGISTPPAAAASCSIMQTSFDPETTALSNANDVSGNWHIKCGANYRVKLVLQYSDATGWHGATCQFLGFGPPCPVTRPSSGWFQGVSEHMGNELWAVATPGHVCAGHLFRIEEVVTFQNGQSGLTLIPVGWDPNC